MSGQTNSFPAVLILQMLSPFMNSNFFQKILARGARARNYEPSKNEHLFRVLQKVAATKKNSAEIWGMAKKNIWTDRIFVKNF